MHQVNITPRQIVSVVAVASTSVLYGLMTGWAAVLPRLQDDANAHFNLTNKDVATLVSMVSFIGVAPSLASGPMVECLGPRRLLLGVLTPVLGLWLMMAFTPYKSLLYVGRSGVAVCTYLEEAILNPLLAEISPSHIRGMALAGVSISSSAGTLIAYLLAHLTTFSVATASRSAILFVVVILMCFVPESPYWLVRRGRVEAARASLSKFLPSKVAVDKEMSAILASPSAKQASFKTQLVALQKGRNLKPVVLVMGLHILRELGGRNAILQYSVYIFRQGGMDLDPFTCTVLLGLTKFLFSIISALSLDRVGRRPLLLLTAGLCGVTQCLAGVFLHLEIRGTSWVPLTALLLYVACYGLGLGPVMGVYLGELLPSPVRSLAVSIINVSFTLTMFAVNFVFLEVLSAVGVGITLVFMGFVNMIMVPIVYKWVPESAKVTLQELEMSFSPKKKHKLELEKPLIPSGAGPSSVSVQPTQMSSLTSKDPLEQVDLKDK